MDKQIKEAIINRIEKFLFDPIDENITSAIAVALSAIYVDSTVYSVDNVSVTTLQENFGIEVKGELYCHSLNESFGDIAVVVEKTNITTE